MYGSPARGAAAQRDKLQAALEAAVIQAAAGAEADAVAGAAAAKRR